METAPPHCRVSGVPSGLSPLKQYRLPGGASRLAALLITRLCPISSLFTPCQPGAALRQSALLQRGQATSGVLAGALCAAILVAGASGASLLAAAPASGQTPRSTRDGVFTVAQAARGEETFRACSYCHGRDLRGGDDPPGPALKGEIFLSKWGGRPLAELFDRIVETMPRDRPGTLEPGAYADVLAHILAANGLPSGGAELASDSGALRDIRLDRTLLESR